MSTGRALVPQLVRWQSVLMVPLLVVVSLTGMLVVGEEHWWFLVGGRPETLLSAPDAAAALQQLLLVVSSLYGAAIGVWIGAGIADLQWSPVSWSLPGVRRALQRELLWLIGGLVPLGIVLRGAGWAAASDMGLAVAVALFWCTTLTAWVQLARAHRLPWPVTVLPYALLFSAVTWPAAYVRVVHTIDWWGVAVLVAGGTGALVHAVQPAVHRALVGWMPRVEADAADDADGVHEPPTDVWGWLTHFRREVPGKQRSPFPHPGASLIVTNAVIFSLVLYFADLGSFLIGLTAVHGWNVTERPLWYPVSRSLRARLQFFCQLSDTCLTALSITAVFVLLSLLDAPILEFFRAEQPPKVPRVIELAAICALLPLGQAGRSLLPYVSKEPPFRSMLLQQGAMIVGLIVSLFAALWTWRLSGQDVGTALAVLGVLAVLLQAANWWYLHQVYARRTLAHR